MAPPPFLALPLELRAMIYVHLLDPQHATRTFYIDDEPLASQKTDVHTAILRVCSQIHAEAAPWLYGSCLPWRLDLGDRTSPSLGSNGIICSPQTPPVRRTHRPAALWTRGSEPSSVRHQYAHTDAQVLVRNAGGTISAAAIGRIRHVELGLGMAKLWRVETSLDQRSGPGKAVNAHWQLVFDVLRALIDADSTSEGESEVLSLEIPLKQGVFGVQTGMAGSSASEDGPSPFITIVEPGCDHVRPLSGRKMLTLRCLPDGAECTKRSRWEFASWIADRSSMAAMRCIGSEKVLRMTQSIHRLRQLLDLVAIKRDVVVVRPICEGFDSLDHWRVYWER